MKKKTFMNYRNFMSNITFTVKHVLTLTAYIVYGQYLQKIFYLLLYDERSRDYQSFVTISEIHIFRNIFRSNSKAHILIFFA